MQLPRDAKPVQSPAEITAAAHKSGHKSALRERLWVGGLCLLHELSLIKQCTKPSEADTAQFLFRNVTLFEFIWWKMLNQMLCLGLLHSF